MKKIFKTIGYTILIFLLLSIGFVIIYKYLPIPITPLMIQRKIENKTPINHFWIPIEKINPELSLAVVASEDNLFLTHNGFDIDAIKLAHEESQKGIRHRGASTISQQTAKNVFLLPHRSWMRKGLEAYFTILIEFFWTKKRIMEVYLNSIEMGNGIYGATAVAKYHFSTTPNKLTRSQCALIAASLPNPRKFNSSKPSTYLLKREKDILRNMKNIVKVDFNKTIKK